MPRNILRWVLGFLMRTRNDRDAAVLAAVALALLGPACGLGAAPRQHTGCARAPVVQHRLSGAMRLLHVRAGHALR